MPEMIYKVIRTALLAELEKEVTKALNEGYVLQGGIIFTGTCYLQAMTKTATSPPFYKVRRTTTAED